MVHLSNQSYGFSSSHVWMWELDYKESWVLKNWCFWTVVLKTLKSPLDCKEIKPILKEILEENNPEYSLEGLMLKLKLQYFGHLMLKSWLIGKDPDSGKDWRQEEIGTTEDKMVGWHHRLDGHEFEQAPRVGDGQGSLACCTPWGHKESDTSERLKQTELKHFLHTRHNSRFWNMTSDKREKNIRPSGIYILGDRERDKEYTNHNMLESKKRDEENQSREGGCSLLPASWVVRGPQKGLHV